MAVDNGESTIRPRSTRLMSPGVSTIASSTCNSSGQATARPLSASSRKNGQDQSGNFKVFCRFRPINSMEAEKSSSGCITVQKNVPAGNPAKGCSETVTVHTGLAYGLPQSGGDAVKDLVMSYDRVFDVDASQADIYNSSAKPLVDELLSGYHCTMFAYGQTGSGKTHTMMGHADALSGSLRDGLPAAEVGVIPRIVHDIFSHVEKADGMVEFSVRISYMEIYLERIHDLLNPQAANLKVREDPARGVFVEGVREVYVGSRAEVLALLLQGGANRSISSTRMNSDSSRSHAVLAITTTVSQGGGGRTKTGRLHLVDLAGSELVNKTQASGQTLTEAKMINKSLSALGNVIKALTEGQAHIPYRDSKLTRILQDALGGDSKTSLIITCSPASFNLLETVSTLRFGTRAKSIQNRPVAHEEMSADEYKRLLATAEAKQTEFKAYIRQLEEEVEALRNSAASAMARPKSWRKIADSLADTPQKLAGPAEPLQPLLDTDSAASVPEPPRTPEQGKARTVDEAGGPNADQDPPATPVEQLSRSGSVRRMLQLFSPSSAGTGSCGPDGFKAAQLAGDIPPLTPQQGGTPHHRRNSGARGSGSWVNMGHNVWVKDGFTGALEKLRGELEAAAKELKLATADKEELEDALTEKESELLVLGSTHSQALAKMNELEVLLTDIRHAKDVMQQQLGVGDHKLDQAAFERKEAALHFRELQSHYCMMSQGLTSTQPPSAQKLALYFGVELQMPQPDFLLPASPPASPPPQVPGPGPQIPVAPPLPPPKSGRISTTSPVTLLALQAAAALRAQAEATAVGDTDGDFSDSDASGATEVVDGQDWERTPGGVNGSPVQPGVPGGAGPRGAPGTVGRERPGAEDVERAAQAEGVSAMAEKVEAQRREIARLQAQLADALAGLENDAHASTTQAASGPSRKTQQRIQALEHQCALLQERAAIREDHANALEMTVLEVQKQHRQTIIDSQAREAELIQQMQQYRAVVDAPNLPADTGNRRLTANGPAAVKVIQGGADLRSHHWRSQMANSPRAEGSAMPAAGPPASQQKHLSATKRAVTPEKRTHKHSSSIGGSILDAAKWLVGAELEPASPPGESRAKPQLSLDTEDTAQSTPGATSATSTPQAGLRRGDSVRAFLEGGWGKQAPTSPDKKATGPPLTNPTGNGSSPRRKRGLSFTLASPLGSPATGATSPAQKAGAWLYAGAEKFPGSEK